MAIRGLPREVVLEHARQAERSRPIEADWKVTIRDYAKSVRSGTAMCVPPAGRQSCVAIAIIRYNCTVKRS